jgi:hypothetical protein
MEHEGIESEAQQPRYSHDEKRIKDLDAIEDSFDQLCPLFLVLGTW